MIDDVMMSMFVTLELVRRSLLDLIRVSSCFVDSLFHYSTISICVLLIYGGTCLAHVWFTRSGTQLSWIHRSSQLMRSVDPAFGCHSNHHDWFPTGPPPPTLSGLFLPQSPPSVRSLLSVTISVLNSVGRLEKQM